MDSNKKIKKLKELVEHFSSMNDTEKLATLLMVPKLLKSENVSDKNLQEVFKCIGIKFIKKLLNNNSKECWLYRKTAVNILLVYSKLPLMIMKVQGLTERLCQLVCLINENDVHLNQCNEGNNGDINCQMEGITIKENCGNRDVQCDKERCVSSGDVVGQKSNDTELTSENIQKENTISPPIQPPLLNQIKLNIYQIMINILSVDGGKMMMRSGGKYVSEMMISSCQHHLDEEVWQLTTTLLTQLIPAGNNEACTVLLPLLHAVFKQSNSMLIFPMVDHLSSLLPCLSQDQQKVLHACDFYHILTTHLTSLHSSKIAQEHKDKCLVLSCRLINQLHVEYFLNNNDNINKNNKKNKNLNNKNNNKNKETFIHLVLRLASMEIMLGLDSEHHPKVDRRTLLQECVVMYEGLVHCEVEFVQDHLYEVLHHVLQFIKEIEDITQQEVSWWHKALLRFTAACMAAEWGMDEGVVNALSSILTLCGKVCVLHGSSVIQELIQCCLPKENNNNTENNSEDNKNNDKKNNNSETNNDAEEALLLMLLPGLGQMTHLEEVRMTMMMDGKEVLMMIFELYARKLAIGSPPPLLHVIVADITCNIAFNTTQDLPQPVISFLFFLAHVLPKESSSMLLGELISYVAAILLIATKRKLKAACTEALKQWSYNVIRRYEKEMDGDDAHARAYQIAFQEHLKL